VQIHAAYTQKGVKLSGFFTGITDKATFEDFIDQLLRHCGEWPELETVPIVDNVGFHYSGRVQQICEDAGVKWDILAPYTLRTDPIEEFSLGEIKTVAKSRQKKQRRLIRKGFETHVKSCIKAVGCRRNSAEGHFRNDGLLC